MADIKEILPYSKLLKALYVEDDENIRTNYAKIFQSIFASLSLAEDGQQGLELFQEGEFDIVITDINMPRMNGIDMIKNILTINEEQSIIVTSAHDETKYLLELIDLGVEKFLLKPIELQKLLTILLRSCKRITELKELREYQQKIEEESLSTASLLRELRQKNAELEKSLSKTTQKENVNLTLAGGIEKEQEFSKQELDYYTPNIDAISALDFISHYSGDSESLNDKLEGIEETLELNIHQKLSEPSKDSVQELASAFSNYALLLESTFEYGNLAQALKHLSSVVLQVKHIEMLCDMKPFLFGISDALQKVRTAVLVDKTAEDIHFLDQSIISDCLQTESMLISDTQAQDDLDDIFF